MTPSPQDPKAPKRVGKKYINGSYYYPKSSKSKSSQTSRQKAYKRLVLLPPVLKLKKSSQTSRQKAYKRLVFLPPVLKLKKAPKRVGKKHISDSYYYPQSSNSKSSQTSRQKAHKWLALLPPVPKLKKLPNESSNSI